MKVLIACEFSGIVREAFKRHGHNAWSCDLLPTEIPGNHIQDDVLKHLDDGWDLMIAHPPCTYLAVSGARWWHTNDARSNELRIHCQDIAVKFFLDLYNADRIANIAIENPIGIMSTRYRKPDQIIQPYQFGHPETKATCLWLNNLPKLQPTNIVLPLFHSVHREPPSPERWKNRSRTFTGIAEAMANQWGNLND
jgi:hypothetical protein